MSVVIEQNSSGEDQASVKVVIGIYILYLAAILLPPLAIIGIIIAYVFENEAKSFLKSHYQYLVRSFWIGILFFGIASLTLFILLGVILLPLCIIWWLIRMAKGLKDVLKNRPIDSPKTWIF